MHGKSVHDISYVIIKSNLFHCPFYVVAPCLRICIKFFYICKAGLCISNAKRSVYLVSAAKNAWDLISSNVDGDDLFPGVSQQTYRYHLKRFCIDHQFSHFVTPYGLRHTFVSLAKTLPAGLVKEQVGHSSNMDTFGVYGHFVNTDQEHLGIALETVFSTIEK